MATSAVVQVVGHYVNIANGSPMAPYLSWGTAATNIQDAVDAALPNEIVLVTNGVYAAGVDAGGVALGGYASGLAQALVLGLAAAEDLAG